MPSSIPPGERITVHKISTIIVHIKNRFVGTPNKDLIANILPGDATFTCIDDPA